MVGIHGCLKNHILSGDREIGLAIAGGLFFYRNNAEQQRGKAKGNHKGFKDAQS